jgi:hypothetical protein
MNLAAYRAQKGTSTSGVRPKLAGVHEDLGYLDFDTKEVEDIEIRDDLPDDATVVSKKDKEDAGGE